MRAHRAQIRRRHDAVGREVGAEHRQIEAGIAAIGHGRPQHQRMRLLLRPMRHVARADVAGEDFFARHFRGGVDTVFQRAVTAVPDPAASATALRTAMQTLALPSGARYTAIPPITLACSTCRRDGRNGIMVVPWVTDLRATPKSSEPAARIDRRAGCYAMPSPITMMTMVSRSVWRARFQHTRTFRQARATRTRRPCREQFRCRRAAVNQCRKRGAALALTPANILSATPMF